MSAPDPVAALREYVRAEGSQRRTGSHAEGALLNEAPRLLAHVERLEAALVAFTSAIDEQLKRIGEPHDCDDLPEDSPVTCGACDEMVRLHIERLGAKEMILALGREIAGRSR